MGLTCAILLNSRQLQYVSPFATSEEIKIAYDRRMEGITHASGPVCTLQCAAQVCASSYRILTGCPPAGDDDDDLYQSLARARKAAEKQQKLGGASLQDSLAEQLASRRDQDEAQQAVDVAQPAGTPHLAAALSASAVLRLCAYMLSSMQHVLQKASTFPHLIQWQWLCRARSGVH